MVIKIRNVVPLVGGKVPGADTVGSGRPTYMRI